MTIKVAFIFKEVVGGQNHHQRFPPRINVADCELDLVQRSRTSVLAKRPLGRATNSCGRDVV
jgi:hypothetical protein